MVHVPVLPGASFRGVVRPSISVLYARRDWRATPPERADMFVRAAHPRQAATHARRRPPAGVDLALQC